MEEARNRPVRGRDLAAALLVLALSFGVYLYSLAPGVIWGDSASLAVQVHNRAFDFGTAGDHPLYVFLGLAFGLLPGDLARNLNLLSASLGALAVTAVFVATRLLTGSVLAAATAAAALAFSHAFWLHSVIAEVYTLNALAAAVVIVLALEWHEGRPRVWLLAAFGTLVLGLSNHLVLGTLLPALLYLVIATRPGLVRDARAWVSLTVAVGTGLLVVAAVPAVRDAIRRLWLGPPPIWHYLAFRTEPAAFVRECGFYLLYLLYQFPGPAALLGVIGAVHLFRTRRMTAVFLLLAWGANALLFLKTTEWTSHGSSKYTFYIQDYVVYALFIGVGTAAIVSSAPRAGALVLAAVAAFPIATYSLAPGVVSRMGIDVLGARTLPYRDNNRFFLDPSKRGEDGAARFADEVFRVVEPGGIVIADYTMLSVLEYAQAVQGRRPDVELSSAADFGYRRDLAPFVAGSIARRHVYIGDRDPRYYNVESLSGRFQLVPAASLLEIVEPRADSVGR